MSKRKQGGKLVQQKRTRPKYLGVKVHDGQKVNSGEVIVKQRGTKIRPGNGVRVGRDHTLYSQKEGYVKYLKKLGRVVVNISDKKN